MIATNYFVAVFLHGQDFPVEVLDVEIDLYQPKPLWAAVDVATQAHPDWRELRIYDVPPLYWEKPGEAAPPVADVAVITRRAEEFRDGQSLEGTALVIRYSSDLQYEERFRLAMGEQRNSAFAKPQPEENETDAENAAKRQQAQHVGAAFERKFGEHIRD